jgi:hypothetical protein
MLEAIISLPNTPSWRGAQLKKHGDNFTFTLRNIMRVIKSKNMGWAGNVARMGEMNNAYSALFGKSEGRRPIESIRLEGMIMLK